MNAFPSFDPQSEVWSHLEGGLQQARDELRALDPGVRDSVERIAAALGSTRGFLILPESKANLLSVEGISRANEALKRYVTLKPAISARALPQSAIDYLKEAAASYLFGFDAACIALCRATLERLLKEFLVTKRIYTEPQLKREQPTAGTLLEKAKQAGFRGAEYDAAKRVVARGDHVLHRSIHEKRILKKTASDYANRPRTDSWSGRKSA